MRGRQGWGRVVRGAKWVKGRKGYGFVVRARES